MFDEIFTRLVKDPNFLSGFDWNNTKEPIRIERIKINVLKTLKAM